MLQSQGSKDPSHMKLLNTAPEIYELKPAGNTLSIPTYAITQSIRCGYVACYLECRGKQI